MSKLILLGGGGHCKSCIDVIEQEGYYEIAGILDEVERVGDKVLDYTIIGTDQDIPRYVRDDYYFLITIGQIQTSSVRQALYNKLRQNRARLVSIISPRAYVSRYAKIGLGTIIMHDALINASATIGENCIINTKALIEHDVVVENFCHISTSAVVNGGVTIKEGSFFGSNAVSKESVTCENNTFIKAGSTFKG